MGISDIPRYFEEAFDELDEVEARGRTAFAAEYERLENKYKALKEIEDMNPCKVEGCGKTDDQKPMAFRGEPFCSDLHRKVLAGELKLETVHVVKYATTDEKSVVE